MTDIDITTFDNTDHSHIEYALTEHQFNEPIRTLLKLARAPDAFQQNIGKYRLILTGRQNQHFLNFLTTKKIKLENFGNLKNAQFLLAFSFGEGSIVNKDLAKIVERIYKNQPSLIFAVQWEIADILINSNPLLWQHIHRIEMDDGKEYITTIDVVEKFIKHIIPTRKVKDKPKVFIVAQAWHAPRCKTICNAKGLDVIGGEFSELFSPTDPQSWVRDAFSWVLKEGTTSL